MHEHAALTGFQYCALQTIAKDAVEPDCDSEDLILSSHIVEIFLYFGVFDCDFCENCNVHSKESRNRTM